MSLDLVKSTVNSIHHTSMWQEFAVFHTPSGTLVKLPQIPWMVEAIVETWVQACWIFILNGILPWCTKKILLMLWYSAVLKHCSKRLFQNEPGRVKIQTLELHSITHSRRTFTVISILKIRAWEIVPHQSLQTTVQNWATVLWFTRFNKMYKGLNKFQYKA